MAIIVEAMQKARDLVSRPANILDTDALIDEIQSLGNLPDTTVSIMRNDAIQQEKMNLLLAVNSGSKDQAAVGVVEYTPKGTESQDPIVLVGKGLIYDSGGLYMKPSGYMNEMHTDMGGAATVVGVMSVLSKIGIQKKVVGICGITENMVDANSFRNGDIITSRKGLTVEIGHTDAEGRLVLADCLSYACDTYKPAQIFDYATLTGACLVALGEMYSGVFSDSQDLIDTLIETGKETNDQIWPLPFDAAVKKAVKSKSADLTNTGNLDRMMGSSTAAAFLANFVDDTEKWVHFDIAGTAARDKMRQSYDYQNLHGTGAGVHLTLEYLLS
ncbi:MAG: leucyl aminopeptidase family protein [Patescibacteria group bacterium]|nr:leucyl aminopeptidase family protein [Patescibacteria group bacterium]